ncbi:DsrE family protein [Halosegnis sp.]|uniref:DsrE family protein n=1 Tax=Halosegnis sp. TaxID=2864959 RepID=UPI0035D4E77B
MGKYAFLINSPPDNPGPIANNLEYARNLDEAGHEVTVFFDGQGTQWIPEAEENPDSVVGDYYHEAKRRGLIDGACGHCAAFFEIDDDIEAAGVALDGGVEGAEGPGDHHGPDVAALAEAGYELINVG